MLNIYNKKVCNIICTCMKLLFCSDNYENYNFTNFLKDYAIAMTHIASNPMCIRVHIHTGSSLFREFCAQNSLYPLIKHWKVSKWTFSIFRQMRVDLISSCLNHDKLFWHLNVRGRLFLLTLFNIIISTMALKGKASNVRLRLGLGSIFKALLRNSY